MSWFGRKKYAFQAGDRHYPVIAALVAGQFRHARPVNLNISRNDHMYAHTEFVLGAGPEVLTTYFRAGMQIADAALQIVDWAFGEPRKVAGLLDFACGFGRGTRFLAAAMPVERIWAADVLPGAVKFQTAEFGVNGIRSSTSPADFHCGRRFDCIFVSSLFSHLPETTFVPWLRALYGLLTPGGVLAFSVHDEAVTPADVVMPPSGFCFIHFNEIPVLATSDYGVAIVTESVVRDAIIQATGRSMYHRIRFGLCHHQDIYVISNRPDPGFSTLRFQHGPNGHLDRFSLNDAGELKLSGWAVEMSPGADVAEIQVVLGGRVVQRCTTSFPRADLPAHLGKDDPKLKNAGWACTVEGVGASQSSEVLMVKALSTSGKEFVLHVEELPLGCGAG
jgi:SAM-dependent methyltransferase